MVLALGKLSRACVRRVVSRGTGSGTRHRYGYGLVTRNRPSLGAGLSVVGCLYYFVHAAGASSPFPPLSSDDTDSLKLNCLASIRCESHLRHEIGTSLPPTFVTAGAWSFVHNKHWRFSAHPIISLPPLPFVAHHHTTYTQTDHRSYLPQQ